MNGPEFKVLRESLGLSAGWLANAWGLRGERAIRRWEDGTDPVPARRADFLLNLEAQAEALTDVMLDDILDQAGLDDLEQVEDLDESVWPVVSVPRVDADVPGGVLPASFFRAIAARVRWETGGHLWMKYDQPGKP